MSRRPVDYAKLVDDIEATLQDATLDGKSSAERLMAHLQDVPRFLQDMEGMPAADGPMMLLVDKDARLVSQNATAARKLGLALGARITDLALTPDAAARFLAAQAAPDIRVPLAIATPAGGTVFLLGHRTEPGGALLLAEARRGISAETRARLATAIGLIPSEAQLLDGLLQGTPTEQVAADLGRKVGTVRQQIKSIMAKMGVNSQAQLISTAYALSMTAERFQPQRAETAPGLQLHQGAELFAGSHGDIGLHSFGPDDGMPVLLLHGALFGILAHAPMRAAAETLGLRLIAPERPGYGNTPLPDNADPVGLCCLQTIDLLDRLGLDRVVVLAHDIGTRFAARLALTVPHRIAAVVAAPATPPMQTWAQTADMPTRHRVNAWAAQHLPGLMDKIVALGLKQIARDGVEVIPKLVFDGCPFDQAVLARPEAGVAMQEGFHLAWAQRGAGFRYDMRLTNEDWQAEAEKVPVRVLCLHGQESLTVSRAAVERLAQTLPEGRFREVAGAGHSLPLTHPAFVLRAVLAAGHAAGLGLNEFG